LNPGQLLEELAGGRLRPAYLLLGEEALLRDEALAAIRQTVLAGAQEDFNLDRLAGETTSVAAFRDAVESLPVMASRRLVVLREPEATRGADKPLVAAMPEVVAEVRAQDLVVLVVIASKADQRSRWVKAFAEPAVRVDCSPPKGLKAIAAFARAEAARQRVELEPAAAALLAERVGPQLLLLRQELSKAALLAGPGEKVLRDHVQISTVQVAEKPIWDLTDAIGEGRTAQALGLLARLLRTGAPPPVVLASLASHFRKLVRVSSGGKVPGPPFVVGKLEQQARRYSLARLRACLGAIHEADTALKGAVKLPGPLVLERLVIGLSA
jgi:DNA polymerase-3 subunit delta